MFTAFRAIISTLLACTLLCTLVLAAKKNEKILVDSGTFGIFVNGTRVATETFQIKQEGDASLTLSEVKAEDAGGKLQQKSELQLASNGDLRRYTWRELSPGKAQEVVEPADQFLIEHITPNAPDKPYDHPYLLPASTMVLDDYFFSHREVLAWRYLAQSCGGSLANGCKLTKAQFGVVIPRQRTSSIVSMEYRGPETVSVRGTQRELDRFNLVADGDDWVVYLDKQLKIVRILIPSANTEVVRD
jgi:hypothetical protein